MKKLSLIFVSVIAMMAVACSGNSKSGEAQTATDSIATEEAIENVVIELAADQPLNFVGPLSTPIVVDFNATWCGPCQQFKPIFEKMAAKYDGKVKFISVDVDRCPEVATEYQVESIPTILFVSTDGNVNRSIGFMEEEPFETSIKALL